MHRPQCHCSPQSQCSVPARTRQGCLRRGGEVLSSTHSLSVVSRGWGYGNGREQSEQSLDTADTCPIQIQLSQSHRHGLGAHTGNKPHPAQYREKVPFSTNWTYTQQMELQPRCPYLQMALGNWAYTQQKNYS